MLLLQYSLSILLRLEKQVLAFVKTKKKKTKKKKKKKKKKKNGHEQIFSGILVEKKVFEIY